MKYLKLFSVEVLSAIQEFFDQRNVVQLVAAVKLLVVNVIEHLVEVTTDYDTKKYSKFQNFLIKKGTNSHGTLSYLILNNWIIY